MAVNTEKKFDRVLALVNKIGSTTEKYQNRIDALEGEKLSYDANDDPEYRRGKRERAEEAELQIAMMHGNNNEATRGYDNSWVQTEEKQFRKAQEDNEAAIRAQMKQQKIAAFEESKKWRLQALKNRYAKVQYRNFYDLNKASEDYNFAADQNYREWQEQQRKDT